MERTWLCLKEYRCWSKEVEQQLKTWAVVGWCESQSGHFASHWMDYLCCKLMAVDRVIDSACSRKDSWPGWKPLNSQFQVLQDSSISAEPPNFDCTDSFCKWSLDQLAVWSLNRCLALSYREHAYGSVDSCKKHLTGWCKYYLLFALYM